MATIKSYTDLSQSKKLAEILPLESADMYWMHGKLDNVKQHPTPNIIGNDYDEPLWNDYDIPCWSLAALLDILSKTAYSIDEDGSVDLCDYKNIEWSVCLSNTNVGLFTENNPVDACYEMILKLHELNLL